MFYIAPLLDCCIELPPEAITPDHKLNRSARLLLCCSVADALSSIAALAIGIVGAFGLIPGMPPAASYSLIAIGIGIVLLWLGCGIAAKTHRVPINLLKKAIDPKPNPGLIRLD